MANRTFREAVSWGIAGVLVLAGVITVVVGLFSSVPFAWFAYQPLAQAVFAPAGDTVFISRGTISGFAVLAVGLIFLAFLAGRRLGKRSTS